MRTLPLMLAATVWSAAPATAQPSQQEQAALQTPIERGTLLYAYDRAAWQGTDDMLAKIPKPEGRIGGWIVDGSADAPELVFYDTNAADPHAVYVARFRQGKLVSGKMLGANDSVSLSPMRKRMIAARGVAAASIAASDARSCNGQRFNTVVLPPSDPQGPVLVYFLTPQTRDAIALGGHFSVEVRADGRAGPIRKFAKSCIAMPLAAPRGGKAVAMVVSHLLDPIPTEIHVFSSLAARKPVYVMIDERVWTVTGNRIGLMDARKP